MLLKYWWELCEPFDQTQARLRELVRLPDSLVCLIKCGRTGCQWFWFILPKQKDLGCRAETPASLFNSSNFWLDAFVEARAFGAKDKGEINWNDFRETLFWPKI